MKNILPLYRGPLLSVQAAAGMAAAARNAKRLADDAQFLLEAKRFATAASLPILALEEHGKSSIIRGLAATSEEMIADGWRAYRNHTAKKLHGAYAGFGRQGRETPGAIPQFVHQGNRRRERASYDIAKQLGFYTDCSGATHCRFLTR